MKLIINPSKPFYINKISKNIRMGNFKETGKEIDFEDEVICDIFKYLKEPKDYENVVEYIQKISNYNKEEIMDTINFFIDEKFIIEDDNYNSIISDALYNREKLYFYMLNDEIIELEKIKDKNLLILGIGAIGSITIELLARAGFNNFTLVDNDIVEKSNLIRQLSYTNNDILKYKVGVMEKRLKSINKNIKVKTINKFIQKEEDIVNEVRNSDFVLCTMDKPYRVIRRLINDICVKENKPVLFSGFSEHVGMIGPFVIPGKTACLSCIEKDDMDEPLNNVQVVPSYGPLCTLISSIISDEIINYFIEYKKNNLIGKTFMFNMYTYNTNIINWEKNSKCKKCGEK